MADLEKKTADQEENLGNGRLEELGANDAGAIPKGTLDPVYEAKARVLNHAVCQEKPTFWRSAHREQIQEIGMGWYQWQLFIVVGFGWANDNVTHPPLQS
jgi:hypothetical protein